MLTGGRQAAVRAMGIFRRDGQHSENVIDSVLSGQDLDTRERALAVNIFYGTIQNLIYIDRIISEFASKSASAIQPSVMDILRTGVYQILFLQKVPDSAAVNEAVKMCRGKYSYAKGFVNALLRRVSREKDSLPVFGNTAAERLHYRYSVPMWLSERLCSEVGEASAEGFFRSCNAPCPVTVQANTLKRESVGILENSGDFARHSFLKNCYFSEGHMSVDALPGYSDGMFYVQDAAAKMSVMAAAPKPGDFVIDVCSAPGGKSFAAAIMMENRGKIYSFDISEKKIKKITGGAGRLGISIISAAACDGRIFLPEYENAADIVLTDVPCSGFGVMRKKPEIRFKSDEETAGLPEIQLAILSNAARYVKPGGILLYSTCTVLTRENSGVTGEFLRLNPDFLKEEFDLPGVGTCAGDVTLWPQIHGTDGFYICRLRKKPEK